MIKGSLSQFKIVDGMVEVKSEDGVEVEVEGKEE